MKLYRDKVGIVHSYERFRTAQDECDDITHCGKWLKEWMPAPDASIVTCVFCLGGQRSA